MELSRSLWRPGDKLSSAMYRVQAQSRVRKPPDFIGRNRRAVRDWGKQGGKPRQEKEERRNETRDTVEISKGDLERLLKMAAALHQPISSCQLNLNTRVQPDLSQIPGLQPQIPGSQSSIPGLQPQIPGQKVQSSGGTLQPQSSALAKIERKKDEEEYYPWGRPGGGAPIRSVSGALLTNYSTRGQEVGSLQRDIPLQPASNAAPHQKPQFARGLGPHVDNFMLTQREEQRRKELAHKEELAAQIAERQRLREAEKHRREAEEAEAERRVRRELEEISKRNELELERRRQKAEEERRWQTELQERVHEAEMAAVIEKQRLAEQQRKGAPSQVRFQQPLGFNREEKCPKKSRIPLAAHRKSCQTRTNHLPLTQPEAPAIARETTSQQLRPLSPVVPALAKKLGLSAAKHTHLSPPLPQPASCTQRHKQSGTSPSPGPVKSLPSDPLPPPPQPGTHFPSQPHPPVARQQQILNQIAVLRQGILSQRKSLDTRFHNHPSGRRRLI